jgi:hypothetical protein
MRMNPFFFQKLRACDCLQHSFHLTKSLPFGLSRQNSDEFITAIANEPIVLVQNTTYHLRNFSKRPGAPQMSVRIDQVFEVVEIKKDQAQSSDFGLCAIEKPIEITMQVSRIIEPGNVVSNSELHHAIMFVFQVQGQSAHAQKICHPRAQLRFADGAQNNVIHQAPKVAGREFSLAAHCQKKKWEKYRLLGSSPISHAHPKSF